MAMTHDQEAAAIELCRRVNIHFLDLLAQIYESTGIHDAEILAIQLRDIGILLEQGDEISMSRLREAVHAARRDG